MFVSAGQGMVAELGAAQMRLLVSAAQTDGALGAAEFTGAQGAWTVPHQHRGLDEYFFVLGGSFAFECGQDEVEATAGSFLMVPRGTRHLLSATSATASVLLLWTPGGLEQMFLELAGMKPGSLTDPAARAAVASRYDSVPV